MKTYTLQLPDELADRVQAYARTLQEQPEDALLRLVEERFGALTAPAALPTERPENAQGTPETNNAVYPDPWADFRGKFTADVPDLLTRHDAYLAEAALDPHEGSPEAEADGTAS